MKAKPIEVIMRIDFATSDGKQIVAHAEKVQALVRCKDCRNYINHCCYERKRILTGLFVRDDDYCSWAERRTNEVN